MRVKKIITQNIEVIISFFITLVFLLLFMIIKGIEPFGNMSFVGGDAYSYVYPFLSEFRRKLLSGDSLLYYWNGSLGAGFLPTYFYSVSSPLNFLVVLAGFGSIRDFMCITIMLRIAFSAGTFAFYLNKKNDSDSSKKILFIPLSCAYALSGFILGFYEQSMWLDSYAILPIILYGYHIMVKDKKPAVYVISLVLSAFSNFFMTFMIAIFLVLNHLLTKQDSAQKYLKNTLRFIGYSLLSAGITGLPILITAVSLLNTRVGDTRELKFEWFGNILNIIYRQFFLIKPITVSYNNNTANIYCGVFTVLLVFLYFFSRKIDIWEKIKNGIILLILYVSMDEAVLNYIWHGFHIQAGVPNRFSFLAIFLLLSIASDVIENNDELFFFLGGCAATVFLTIAAYSREIDSLVNSDLSFVLSLILLFIYSVLFIVISKKSRKLYIVMMSVIMISEVIFQSVLSLNYTATDKTQLDGFIESAEQIIQSEQKDVINRSEVVGTMESNGEVLLGLNGIAEFNGFIDNNVRLFLNNLGYFNTEVAIEEKGGFSPINEILGISSIYSCNESFGDYIDHMGYSQIYNDGNLSVYNNPNALSLGFGIDGSNTEYDADDYDYYHNVNLLTSNMTGTDNILSEIYPEYDISGSGFNVEYGDVDYLLLKCHTIEGHTDPYIKVSFVAEKTGYYNMVIRYQNYGAVVVAVNGSPRRYETIQGQGILSLGKLYLDDNVDILIGNSLESAEGLPVYSEQILDIHMAIINEAALSEFFEKANANPMITHKISDSHLKSTVSLSQNQILFTSIPYNEGWHIYENGVELKKDKYAGTFISLDLGEGEHNLEWKYIPKGLYPGIVISVLSLLIFVAILLVKSKSNDNDIEAEDIVMEEVAESE